MPDIRWKQRFQNFENAFRKFQFAANTLHSDPQNELYQLALIQSFEFTYELGWKTMKDYLKVNGIHPSMPREVIKEAFSYGIIEDGHAWIGMLEDRNLMAHTYDEKKAKVAIHHILTHYVQNIKQVFQYLHGKL